MIAEYILHIMNNAFYSLAILQKKIMLLFLSISLQMAFSASPMYFWIC